MMTGTMRHRHSRAGRRQFRTATIAGADFDPVMVNFQEMGTGAIALRQGDQALGGASLLRAPGGLQYLVGMAVDPDIAPNP